MSKKIYIDQNSFTRTKKKLKSSLEEQGVSLSLSEVATVLAQSFGFKSENEMQRLYFNQIEDDNSKYDKKYLSLIEDVKNSEKGYVINHEIKDGIDIIELTYRSIKRPFAKYDEMVDDLMLKYIDQNEKGHVIVAGSTGAGKSTLLNKIIEKHKNLVSLNSLNPHKYFNNDEVRDIVGIEKLNKYSNLNIIFSLHAVSGDVAIKRLKSIANHYDLEINNNIRYVIHINRLY